MADSIDVISYAYYEFEASAEEEAEIYLSADGGGRLWFNGADVYINAKPSPAAPNRDRVSVRLRKGRNTILLKIASAGARNGFFLRLESTTELKAVR